MITVEHLTKRYGDFTAVDDISFTIEDGHIYGFLGHNGAGKSTTMNIMTGCLAATSGEVRIDVYDIFEQARQAKQCIGYLPEIPPLYPDETPEEYLRFVAQAKGVPNRRIPDEIQRVMQETRLTEMGGRLIRNLSKGYRQRVGIAQALLGNPKYIILDEPTVGLDPLQIIEIRDLIRELGRKHTVILSSHILSEVQAICESVLIIAHGKLVAFDTPRNLEQAMTASSRLSITAEADEARLRAILDGEPAVAAYTIEGEDASESAAPPAAPGKAEAAPVTEAAEGPAPDAPEEGTPAEEAETLEEAAPAAEADAPEEAAPAEETETPDAAETTPEAAEEAETEEKAPEAADEAEPAPPLCRATLTLNGG